MKEKKLTDEEIVKALDICYSTPCCTNECPYFNKSGRNFCVENKAFYKDMKRIVQEHAEQKAEIERLTEENGQLNGYNSGLEYELELKQKQVDELKEELKQAYETERANIQAEIAEAGTSCHWCKQEAVKDTAKEIWNDITSYYFSLRVIGNATVELDKLAEFWHKRGVEVE